MTRMLTNLLAVIFLLLSLASNAANTSDITRTSTPATSPDWKSGFPRPEDIEPRKYSNPSWDQNYTCTNPEYHGIQFNLVEVPNCGTHLSQDLYGWGVRIGFYTTWFASLFANVFVPKEVRSAIDANSIFLFALEISVLKATFYDHDLMKIDALILFLIGIGTAIGALSLWGRRTRFWYTEQASEVESDFGGIGTYARLLLSFFLGLYGLWFWYSPFKPGLLLAGSCDPRCWTAFVFGTKLYSGIRWLFFTFTLLCEIYWTFLIVLLTVCAIPAFRRRWRNYNRKFYNVIVSLRDRVHLSNTWSKRAGILIPTCNLLWYIFIITLIEVTLHQNQQLGTLITASASTSPAQLIPFLIGIVTLTRLIWVYRTEGYKTHLEDLRPFVVYENIRAHSNSSESAAVAPNKGSV